jgi:hypothetical protein
LISYQFEFVNQLSTNSENTIFALVRSKSTANRLVKLGRPNVHILEADITNTKDLKVGVRLPSDRGFLDTTCSLPLQRFLRSQAARSIT